MLSIEAVIPELKAALVDCSRVVLQAPPGAGKTTRIPPALLDEPWLNGRRIVMLEPRRLAARAAARYMACLQKETVGQTIGYRVRLDTRVGPSTRVEVVTEGVLTRLLQADPALEGTGLVIFDEFHERSLQTDLGLALCLETGAILRNDLRILVMSATLDGEAVSTLMDDAPVLTSKGRLFPVSTHYLPHRFEGRIEGRIESAVVQKIVSSLSATDGDILVFLPGAGEIRRVEKRLKSTGLAPEVCIAPLFGNLPHHAQDKAIAPSGPGERKIVLATSIAETSLTIEGIHVVIDAGLMRVPRFSPRSGMTKLVTVPVSKASADQRRGRAGRLGPGVCYRLWTKHQQRQLTPHNQPEIMQVDLAPLALELACRGHQDPDGLSWLDRPPAAAFDQARDLLAHLGALDHQGAITQHGRRMVGMGCHPRLAHMILKAKEIGLGSLACGITALLNERDLFRSSDTPPDADLRLRLEVLRSREKGRFYGLEVDEKTLRRVNREARHWRKRVGITSSEDDIEACGFVLAFAYPDRIAQQRPGQAGRYKLSNGRAAAFMHPQPLSDVSYIVAALLDGQQTESNIFLAAPIDLELIKQHFADQITENTSISWDPVLQVVNVRLQSMLGALVLKEAPHKHPDPGTVAQVLLDGITQAGLDVLPWTREARNLQARLVFLRRLDPEWPDLSDSALFAGLSDWLMPHIVGKSSLSEVRKIDLAAILRGKLTWRQNADVDMLAPTHWLVPSGSRIRIDYDNPESPVLAVRLQEMFGLTETPRIAGGKVPLTLHLLSPARRPVQVTQDLESFWKNGYFDVKKDLKGRYPKHYWPDDPLLATPTQRIKPEKKNK